MTALKKGVIFLIFLFCMARIGDAAQSIWIGVAGDIEKSLGNALSLYESGKTAEAMEKVADTYFGIFEGEKTNMEIAVRKYLSLKKASELEKGFGDLRKSMSNKIPLSDIKSQTANLMERLKGAAKELDRKGVLSNE